MANNSLWLFEYPGTARRVAANHRDVALQIALRMSPQEQASWTILCPFQRFPEAVDLWVAKTKQSVSPPTLPAPPRPSGRVQIAMLAAPTSSAPQLKALPPKPPISSIRAPLKPDVTSGQFDDLISVKPPVAQLPVNPTGASKDPSERRAHKRYEVKLEVRIFADGLSFIRQTENLSQGGILIDEALPAYLQNAKTWRVVLSKPGQASVELKAQTVGGPNALRAFQFVQADAGASQRIEKWTQSGVSC